MELKYFIPLVPLAVACYRYYKFRVLDKYLDEKASTRSVEKGPGDESAIYDDRSEFWDATTNRMEERAINWVWITVITVLLVVLL